MGQTVIEVDPVFVEEEVLAHGVAEGCQLPGGGGRVFVVGHAGDAVQCRRYLSTICYFLRAIGDGSYI